MKRCGEIKYSLRRYDYLEGNFTQISNDVFKLTNGNEFKIYCYLCSNYNRELGYSFPSLNTISKNTNMSVPTVTKCIKSLEKLGLIKICKFENKMSKYINNIYKIFIPIIVKNDIEDQEQDEIRKLLETVVNDVEGKIYTLKIEYKEDEEKDGE